ncbi:MFS transporter [Spirosoma sp. HMF4905]|uniref:MFS transporter n=1 Tax=Spirosoma arboris TaxID=2682092 RepID=A0A7K1S702_9BACT|nr:MFS transporter [Spirosoma arboris]MVM29520.1 MFS transporter [Spirosoma arboris]
MNTMISVSIWKSRYQATVLGLGIGHGFSDAAAGYLIGNLSHNASFVQIGSAVMIYNLLAFGGQLPAGIWLDRIGHYRKPAVLSLLGMVLALGLLCFQFFWVAIVIAGISSAIFHVSGGAVTLVSFPGKSYYTGIFSAFGVMGLALGGWAGTMHWYGVGFGLMTGLIALLLGLLKANFPLAQKQEFVTKNHHLDNHDYLMILLLVAIALRSAVWNVVQLLYVKQYDWLIYMAMAAMIGKLIGGWLTDRIPWKVYALVALSIAIPSLAWGHRKLFWLLLGTGLLQSLTPISVVALQRLLPTMPAAVSGATFGLAIALGGLISFVPLDAYFPLFYQLILLGMLTWGLYYLFWSGATQQSTLHK